MGERAGAGLSLVDKSLVRFDWLCDPDAGGLQWDGIEDISQSSLKFLLKLFVKHFAVRRRQSGSHKNAISTFANDDEKIRDNFTRNENILADNVV